MEFRELRSSLQTLSDQSLKTSRHLDDTYYSILEKVSLLRQTIGSLQELSGLTKELHENFRSDTQELVEDIKGQFDAFGNFEKQQEQVAALEERIKAGKEKADSLTARLMEAKKRVEARAKSEAEWDARITRTLACLYYTSLGANLLYRTTEIPLGHPRHYRGSHHTRNSLPAIQTPPLY